MLVKERMGSGDNRSRKRRVIGVNLERRNGEDVGVVVVVAMLWDFNCYFLGVGLGWVLEFAGRGRGDAVELGGESDDE